MSSFNVKSIQQTLLWVFVLTIAGSSVSCGQSSWRKPNDLFKAMKIQKGNWAADVGSGDGDYTVRMAPLVENSGRIFAVDIDEEKLNELHEELAERGINNVTTIYSLPGNPMLPPNSMDAVLIRNAYHEFREYKKMLKHVKKSLKPGGRLVIAEPMEEEVAGANREAQVDEHSIAMKFVRQDLKNASFNIIKEVEHFTANKWRRYWMIIAKRPEGEKK